ncbi:MAG TPA: serine/threonine-protein kinase [Terriglobales bacterium]|nr:serine/threonine-protein kinase [Terriglobales bacterium]
MDKVRRYEIVGELGRGAMGVVYRAIDPTIGRTVALKTTRLDLDEIGQDELLRRLRNEAHAAGQMNHANIVTIHDAGECDGLFYIAMEYLEGETLQSLMAEQRLIPTDQIVEIARQVAAGLDYAHAMKVVHRDIKPANIMIMRQNIAKIMDFGISKSIGTLTRTGQILGTPYYMSPEQVMGHAVDGRCDLFSFGVVLYEMATGARPFGGDTVATVIYKIINETPPSPSELQAAIHPELSAVITRCMEKRPEDRYQTGAQLAADLDNFPNLHSAEWPATVSRSTSWLQQTQATGLEAAAAVAVARSGPVDAVQATTQSTKAPRTQPGNERPKNPLARRERVIWISAVLILVVFAAFSRVRRHRGSHQHSTGGASVVVNVPANLGKHERREVAEKREIQHAQGSPARRSSLLPTIPDKEQTLPAQTRVSVSFTSTPAGASIRLDGQSDPAWITPYIIADVAPGIHEVVFYKQGYSPQFRELEVGASDATYGVDLVPK